MTSSCYAVFNLEWYPESTSRYCAKPHKIYYLFTNRRLVVSWQLYITKTLFCNCHGRLIYTDILPHLNHYVIRFGQLMDHFREGSSKYYEKYTSLAQPFLLLICKLLFRSASIFLHICCPLVFPGVNHSNSSPVYMRLKFSFQCACKWFST